MLKSIFGSNLFKSSGIYTLANIANAAIPFLLLPILTRYLSPEDYGLISMFKVIGSVTYPIIDFGIQASLKREYIDREKIDYPKYLFNSILFATFIAVVISVLYLIFGRDISYLTKFPIEWLFSIILFAYFQFVTQTLLTNFLVRFEAFKYSFFLISMTVLNIGLSIYLVVGLGMNWKGRIIAQIIVLFIYAVIAIYILTKKNLFKVKLDLKYIKKIVSYGFPLIPHALGAWVINLVDRLFLASMVGLAITGIYTVGYQIGMIIGVFQDSFNKAWLPWFFERLKENKESTKRTIVKITYAYFVIIIISVIGLTIIAPILLKIFVGAKFQSANKFVLWVALGYAFNGMYKMVSGYIFYTKDTKYLGLFTSFTAIINVILNYFLINSYGAIGAAYSTAASFLILFILTFYISIRKYKMPWFLG